MSNQPEKQLVEDYLVKALPDKEWTFINAKELKRASTKEAILEDNFKSCLRNINQKIKIGDEEIDKVIQEIKLLPNSSEGVRKFLRYLKYGIGVRFEKEKVIKFVNLIDYKNPSKNEFIITRQITYRSAKEEIVPDIILYINGLPIVIIECKNPASLAVDWQEGYKDVVNYWHKVPEPFKYMQIGISAGAGVRYFPIVPQAEEARTYKWREENKDEIEAIVEYLSPERVIDFVRNFIFVREEHGEITKVMARYMQYRAVNKIYNRTINHIEGKDKKNKGLVWHWQGSGKTFTMIFAGHKIYLDERMSQPTMFFIVDRIDLMEQLTLEFNALDLNINNENINFIKDLKDVIKTDNFQGKRGVFVSLMQKLRPDEKFIPDEMVEAITKKKIKTIADRKNVVLFLDEVQRTQYGLLAAQMKKIFKNASAFGFTGTPIAEEDRNTYNEFGYPVKEEAYLDRYFVDDSLKDKFTVPIVWQPRKEKEVHLNNEVLKAFSNADIETLEDEQKKQLEDKVQKKLNQIKIFLENKQRIEVIARDIAKHYQKNVKGKFKVMVVAGSRKACVMYKNELDKYLPTEASELVMTFNQASDSKEILDYYKKWKKNYPECKNDRDIVKRIVESYKEKDKLKVIIVTDMLLTGFDAPILQTMYLDKPMKKHKLLQAIARVNRLYKGVKKAGLIVDYIGILKEVEKAYEMYYKDDNVGVVFRNIDYVVKEYKEALNKLGNIFSGIKYDYERATFLKALDKIRDEETEREFTSVFKEARKIHEFLGSHEIKLKYLDDYKWHASVYAYHIKIKNSQTDNEREQVEKYYKSTIEAIKDNLQIKEINDNIPRVKFGIEYFTELESSKIGKEEKAVNILFALEKLVLVDQRFDPIYKTIAEKVEELVKKWKNRQIGFELLYEEEEKVISVLKEKQKEREELGLGVSEYGLYIVIKNNLEISKKETKEATEKLVEEIKQYAIDGWQEHPVMRQNIHKTARQFLVKNKAKYNLSLDKINYLYEQIIEVLQNYEA